MSNQNHPATTNIGSSGENPTTVVEVSPPMPRPLYDRIYADLQSGAFAVILALFIIFWFSRDWLRTSVEQAKNNQRIILDILPKVNQTLANIEESLEDMRDDIQNIKERISNLENKR